MWNEMSYAKSKQSNSDYYNMNDEIDVDISEYLFEKENSIVKTHYGTIEDIYAQSLEAEEY